MNIRFLQTILFLLQLTSTYTTYTSEKPCPQSLKQHGGAQPPTPPVTPPKRTISAPTPSTTPIISQREDPLLLPRSDRIARQLFPPVKDSDSDSENPSPQQPKTEINRLDRVSLLNRQIDDLTTALREAYNQNRKDRTTIEEYAGEIARLNKQKFEALNNIDALRSCIIETLQKENDAYKREKTAQDTIEKLRKEQKLWNARGCTFKWERPVFLPGDVPAIEVNEYHIRQPSASCIVGPCVIS